MDATLSSKPYENLKFKFFARWLFFSLLASSIARAMSQNTTDLINLLSSGTEMNEVALWFIAGLTTSLVKGLIIGFAQFLVFRNIYKNSHMWILYTIAGFTLASFVLLGDRLLSGPFYQLDILFGDTQPISMIMTAFINGFIGYGILGVFQWFILRNWFTKSWTWIPIQILIGFLSVISLGVEYGPCFVGILPALLPGLFMAYMVDRQDLQHPEFRRALIS